MLRVSTERERGGAIASVSAVQSNCTRNMGDEERGLDKAGT